MIEDGCSLLLLDHCVVKVDGSVLLIGSIILQVCSSEILLGSSMVKVGCPAIMVVPWLNALLHY
jgi:hypothetical protein